MSPSAQFHRQPEFSPWKHHKKAKFISMSAPEIPGFSQGPQVSSTSFPHTLKLPSLNGHVPLLPPPVSDSTDDNFTEDSDKCSNLQVIPKGYLSNLTKESGDRIFIQDPPWISSLYIKSLLFRSRIVNGVKIEFKEMEMRKYQLLRRRQVTAETEAWENMVEEYRELEREMCDKKLAPHLPHVKKLMLGWFEPLRAAIERRKNSEKTNKHKKAFAPYIDALPADKMAIIVMHKIMGLLMMGGKEERCVRVVEAAVQIGVAIEHEVRIHDFLVKTKKHERRESVAENRENSAIMRKRVKHLIKRNKIIEVQKLVRNEESEPWGRDVHAKLGCCLIELLTESAYVQPPFSQSADSPPDVRPAFRHLLRVATKEPGQNVFRRYGVIECDPLVLAGLDKTVRHIIIPYVPMLVPPKKWKGYDKGGYLFLPSYLMRTHGSRKQQDAVRRTPAKQMQKIFEALDTLGNTKWRANKRILGVVERIWAAGGNIAGLVNREDVALPELLSDDVNEVKNWKWSVKKAKKINQERHSQRCDTELKLSDGSCNGLQHYAALGRDSFEAAAVNLVTGDKPADVYSEIAERVHSIMKRDSEKNPETDPTALMAKLLVGQVDRKLVKQTVMTSVYGVTYVGAREQIKRRLQEKGIITDDRLLFSAASYAAKVTLAALGELFEAARAIMGWLGDCAQIIASEDQPVCWTTPLGLPVVQPYFKTRHHVIRTSLQVLALQREGDSVEMKKQRTAFPPNLVHSLDGTHMMMTAVACRDARLQFAGVHDSFWTHACDVDRMNQILRQKFVDLYSMPILENLLESFQRSYPTLTFPPLLDRGNFDLEKVLHSPYFFN